jgi:hypothetical protein
MTADAKHIPILCIDVQGFTTHNTETQRTIVRRLQRMATEAARFFMPYGDPWTNMCLARVGSRTPQCMLILLLMSGRPQRVTRLSCLLEAPL